MKRLILLGLCLVGVTLAATNAHSAEMYTIYLVRHAEKQSSDIGGKNPPLTQCGEQRAENLAQMLASVQLGAVYSSEYRRTQATAEPTAQDQGIAVTPYDPRQLESFAQQLLRQQRDMLVVGHSNTTGVLAGLLIGETLSPFDEKIYDRIYQVVVYKDQARLHILHQPFHCNT